MNAPCAYALIYRIGPSFCCRRLQKTNSVRVEIDLLVARPRSNFFLAVLLAFLISGLYARGMLHAAWPEEITMNTSRWTFLKTD